MQLTEEIYYIFSEYDKTMVEMEIANLSEYDMKLLKNAIQRNKYYSKTIQEVFSNIKRRLARKDLKKHFGFETEEEVEEFLNSLTSKQLANIKKEFFFKGNIPLVKVDSKTKSANLTLFRKRGNFEKSTSTHNFERSHDNQDYKPFYEVFEGYSKEEVDRVMKFNTKEENELLYLKYGSDLTEIKSKNLLSAQMAQKVNDTILKKMKRRLNSIKNGTLKYVNVKDVIPNVSRKDLVNRVKYILPLDRDKLYGLFGKRLNKECLVLGNRDLSISKTSYRILSEGVYMVKITPICKTMSSFKKDEETDEEFMIRVKRAIESLNPNDKDLIYRKYGKDLRNEEYDFYAFNDEEKMRANHIIIAMIKHKLGKEITGVYSFGLFDRYKWYSKEEVLTAIERLKEEDRNVLKEVYGDDYSRKYTFRDFPSSDKIEVAKRKLERIILSNRSRENGIMIYKLRLANKLLRSEEYKLLLNKYDANKAFGLVMLKNANDIYTDQEFLALCSYTKDEIASLLDENHSRALSM